MSILLGKHLKKTHSQGKTFQKNIFSWDMGDCLGFTLVELMFVTSIIGILASIAIPHYIEYRKKAQVAKVASNLVNFEKGFTIYAIEQGGYPNDSHMVLPDQANMAKHIDPADWAKPTPLGGGTFNWEGPDNYPYAGVSIFESTAPVEDFVLLDELMDDGNLSTGRFRLTPNGRYTYIIDE